MAADADPGLNEPLPWHVALWQRLAGARRSGRLPHALLLTGAPGLGKERFARLLAHTLLCETPGSDLPCGACRGCRLAAAGNHPDLLLCGPAEDKSVIDVDQIRSITRFLSLKPHYGEHQVVIIVPAERMNPSAANSLLKTLEEPSAGAVLLLVTPRPALLPATVRSRCQRLAFAVPDRTLAAAWLEARLEPGSAAPRLLDLAGGAPLAALALAGEGLLARRDTMLAELSAVARAAADPLTVAAAWLKFDLKESLYWVYGWLGDMARLQASERPPHLSSPDQRPLLQELARALPMARVLEQAERVSAALRLADGQGNAQLLLEDVLIAWADMARAEGAFGAPAA